jgi:hypothetical protein
MRVYIDKTVELMSNREQLKTLQDDVRCKARERFSLQKIMKEWEKVFNE